MFGRFYRWLGQAVVIPGWRRRCGKPFTCEPYLGFRWSFMYWKGFCFWRARNDDFSVLQLFVHPCITPSPYALNKVGYSQITDNGCLMFLFFSRYASLICDGLHPPSKTHPRLWEILSRSGGTSHPSRCVATPFPYWLIPGETLERLSRNKPLGLPAWRRACPCTLLWRFLKNCRMLPRGAD